MSDSRHSSDRFRYLLWSLYAVASLLTALLLSWQMLRSVDFLYPLWYELLDIDQTVAEYGPRNRNRHQFELTDHTEHQRLFAAIVTAIHHDGAGLTTLTYQRPDGRPIGTLLTDPEVVHLRDVARLVSVLLIVGWVALIGWLLLAGLLIISRRPPPTVGTVITVLVVLLIPVALIIMVFGPVTVFYRLHEWIFPAGHQWFFYYRDSLMTTLMKAPLIFGPIAALLTVLTAIWMAVLSHIVVVLSRRRSAN